MVSRLYWHFSITTTRELRTRGNWWNLNVSETLYTRRMARVAARWMEEERARTREPEEEHYHVPYVTAQPSFLSDHPPSFTPKRRVQHVRR